MKKMKFRVYSREHSKAIQKRLFELGYKWAIEPKKKYSRLDSKFLYMVGTKLIGSEDCEEDFLEDDCEEGTLNDLYKKQYPEIGALCLVWGNGYSKKYFSIHVGDGKFVDYIGMDDTDEDGFDYENYEVITDLNQFKDI